MLVYELYRPRLSTLHPPPDRHILSLLSKEAFHETWIGLGHIAAGR